MFVVVLLCMCVTSYFFYPETRGHSLEQMAWVFEGEEAGVLAGGEVKERARSISVEVVGEKEEGFGHEEKV